MITPIWTVLCRQTIVDADSQTLSFIECMERLVVDVAEADVNKKINVPINYEIVSYFGVGHAEEDRNLFAQVVVYNGEDREIGRPVSLDIAVSKDRERIRLRNKIAGFVVDRPGNYRFQVLITEKPETEPQVIAEIPLEVVLNIQTS